MALVHQAKHLQTYAWPLQEGLDHTQRDPLLAGKHTRGWAPTALVTISISMFDGQHPAAWL